MADDAYFNVGLADVNTGIKYALWHTDDFLLAFQFTDCLMLEGEFRSWSPLEGTEFAGSHLRYGIGAYYDIYACCDVRVSPVVEFIVRHKPSGALP